MLVPHSDLAPNGPKPMEAANAVDTHSVDDLPSARFTWTIENFMRLNTEKLYSQIFLVGGYKWRVLVFPKGKKVEHFSMYLDVADSATLPYGWSRHAQFSLAVIDQRTNKFTVRKDTEHKFGAGVSDWGFTYILPLVELNDPVRGFLVNDTVVLEAVVTILNSHDSRMETGFEPKNKKGKKETGDNGSGNVEADIAGTTCPESTLSDATATAGKVRFLSYWVSSEALLLLEKIHSLHEGTYVKFSMKGQALPTVLLESFAALIASMSSTKVNELNEEALQLAANSTEDFEQVGLDLRWLKQRLEEAKVVKKHSESINTVESCTSALEVARATVDSCTSALEVARAKVRELEDGLARAKLEGEVMSRELPKSLGVNDSVLKDIV
ncbi:MATH domain and coiled-coil domain-containing protein At3g58270-like isoform X2 [Rhododendron vialii]|uniref:MATH domain and coiled-coil domain-containing protein At3g58270-like isoform X2 n=1 Tax=Rhododendron vialii TaxID=182163 RepID=UPI00265EEC10|nr:MATH domain and coiled-coil domain-containing protein At3g58270-like isoform X2 [Rhododendron vialii]